MKKEMKKYELINNEGAFYCMVFETSWIKARKCFNQSYEGSFTIICEGERKNVILKSK